MRQYGYRIVDELVGHFVRLPRTRPISSATRKEMDRLLAEEAPEEGTDPEKVLDFVLERVLKNSDLLTHPKSFSFVPSPSNFVSVMADTLATGFNVFSGGWFLSPGSSEIEIVTINWMLKLFGFPVQEGGGLFTSGGSMANLMALTAARHLKCGEDFSKAMVYMSHQAHSSNLRAMRVLGFKKAQVRLVSVDENFAVDLSELSSMIEEDKRHGLHPICVLATAGTTNSGAVDPLDEVAKICQKEKVWFHVDAAYGGAAMLCKCGKERLIGIEKADSITVDPHKWFFQPYEIGCLLVRNQDSLFSTFSEHPEYLRDMKGSLEEINFFDYGIQLTRSFRALKFYMSIKTFGLASFREAVKRAFDLADEVQKWLEDRSGWEVMSKASLAVICFRYNPGGLDSEKLNAMNQFISDEMTRSKQAILVTTLLWNQVVLRMCLINPRTKFTDVQDVLLFCEKKAQEYLRST